MLTEFGKEIRKIRIDKGLRLLDLAERISMSSAFVSAVETGRKPVPADYPAMVGAAMGLSVEETQRLERAADQDRSQISIGNLPSDTKELLAAFARRVDDVPPHILDELRKAVFKSLGADIPFQRRRRGVLVPPTLTTWLRQFAENVRSIFVGPDDVWFPIMDVLENRLGRLIDGFYLDVWSAKELDGDEGRVIAGEHCLILRDDVYKGAWLNDGRGRFTACHELLHFLLHRRISLARSREDHHEVFRDSEWQADTFAGTLLMSPRHAKLFRGAQDGSIRCGMTQQAASVMLAKYHKGGAYVTLYLLSKRAASPALESWRKRPGWSALLPGNLA